MLPSGSISLRRGAPVSATKQRGRRGRPFPLKPIEERHRIAARKLANGAAIMPTLIEAGYSNKVARQGVAVVQRLGPIRRAVLEELEQHADAPVFESGRRKNIVVNKLLHNLALGRDMNIPSLNMLARIEGMLQNEGGVTVQIAAIVAPSPDQDEISAPPDTMPLTE